MPVEFVRQNACYDIHEKIVCDSTKLEIAYDGTGRRISKMRVMKIAAAGDWYVDNVTHYTGIGTEVRETHVNGQDETKVVVNMPQGLGRYTPEDAVDGFNGVSASQRAGYRPPAKFEWYLKNHQGESSENALVHFHCRAAEFCALRQNHLGSTMLVYGTSAYSDLLNSGYKDGVKAAYDYRAFGVNAEVSHLEKGYDGVETNWGMQQSVFYGIGNNTNHIGMDNQTGSRVSQELWLPSLGKYGHFAFGPSYDVSKVGMANAQKTALYEIFDKYPNDPRAAELKALYEHSVGNAGTAEYANKLDAWLLSVGMEHVKHPDHGDGSKKRTYRWATPGKRNINYGNIEFCVGPNWDKNAAYGSFNYGNNVFSHIFIDYLGYKWSGY